MVKRCNKPMPMKYEGVGAGNAVPVVWKGVAVDDGKDRSCTLTGR